MKPVFEVRKCLIHAPWFKYGEGLAKFCVSLSALAIGSFLTLTSLSAEDATTASLNAAVVKTEAKTLKLYGAGGSGLESYQSGFFVSGEGHILTAWSTVLDVDEIIVVTSDGGRYESTVIGIDPNLEIAVLKTNEPTPNYFDLTQAVDISVGERVMAISNLYGIATGREMASVQKGVVMAKTELQARRGSFESVYQGPVLIIDAMTNNPGAAGGVLTTLDGKLVGILGKELKDSSANIWLNYAIPIAQVQDSVARIIAGKSINRTAAKLTSVDRPTSLKTLGLIMVPNVLAKTPAFVDLVEPDSLAAKAGLKSDDLILFVNSVRVPSQSSLLAELKMIDRLDEIVLLVQRGNALEEITIQL